MKTGRPRASKNMPGKIAPKVPGGAPMMPPGGQMPGAGPSNMPFKKGGKVRGKKGKK